MKVTENVIHDLAPAYLSGEASADTVLLVEEFLRLNPDLAPTLDALRNNPLPELPMTLQPTQEKEALDMTKQLLRWRGNLMGLALFLTMLPLSFRFDHGRIAWMFLHEAPPLATALVCLGAVSCWAGFLYVRRRLEITGL
jgi:hypothetical protein